MDAAFLRQIFAKYSVAALLSVSLLMRVPSAGAQTTTNSPARLQKFSKLPDWSGIWSLKGSPALLDSDNGKPFDQDARDHPPYNAEWEAKYGLDLVRAAHQGDVNYPDAIVDTHTIYCAAGMPHIIGTPFDYEFIVTPEETWIIVDKETRHIYTDGRGFPPEDELWPTLLGRSIGHWEGQALMVETISVKSGLWADFTPAMFSDQARFAERIRQIDGNTLEDQVTISDPVAFTRPWTFTKHYTRMKPMTWAAEPETCGTPGDRNPIVNGHVTVVLPTAK
jgi:hypothetical protein